MREFKFIRGKYTDENIFNTDETDACLFACDKNGGLVQFIEKNDKDFQEKFVGLSSDSRLSEIYTLRPSQFKISAQKESAGHYSFNFQADENVYDNSRQFPPEVVKSAATHIKARTEAAFNTTSGLPILNLYGEVEQQTPMIFTFNNKKSFTRNLVFKVSGFLKERGYVTAQGEGITAYPKSGDKIDFGEKTEGTEGTNATQGTFYQGVKQKEAETKIGTIYANTEKISASGSLSLAKNYESGENYIFIKGDQFETNIPYQDGLSFYLYEKVSEYLTEAESSKAVTSETKFDNNNTKYEKNNTDYELSSNPSVTDDVEYFTIISGSSDSDTKLRKVSDTKYSIINDDGCYFVDNITPTRKDFSTLGSNIMDFTNKDNAIDTITVESGKVAFVKTDNGWEKVNSDATITKCFATKVSGTKVYIESVTSSIDAFGYTTYSLALKNNTSIPLNNDTEIIEEYFYNGTSLTGYCDFDANNQPKTVFVDVESLDNIINNNSAGTDYTIYTPVAATKTTTYKLNNDYVAYDSTVSLSKLIDEENNYVYARNEANEKDSITSLKNYNFYYVHSGTAYMSKGDCKVPDGLRKANEFVEGYAASYENYFIFKNNKLINISSEDISGKSTITYYENDDHHIIGNGVYDDANDDKKYVKFSADWQDGIAISSENAFVNEDNVPSPKTTESVLRFITEVEVKATQSD